MKNFILLLIIPFFSLSYFSQIQHVGEPMDWNNKTFSTEISFYSTPPVNMTEIQQEDSVVDLYKSTPYRFGVEINTSIDFFDEGSYNENENGDRIWRFGIHCPEATSINFVFGEYNIPVGGEVYVYDSQRKEYLGSFTSSNNKDYGSLSIGVIHSDRIVIEYFEPYSVRNQAQLMISQITHGYRPILSKNNNDKGPIGTSGACNININCPDGDPWQNEKRSVGLILTGGFVCTGSLINNTNNNGVPYFLAAEHCGGTESNWVVYFNHEYSGCSNSGAAPLTQSISGAVVKASNPSADGLLTQLTANIPASYQPYYNGWDNSGSAVSNAVCIHHPNGDVKKISFDDDPLQKTFYGSNTTSSNGNNWRIESWERNTTTEGGSSGSPLYDQDHRLIGQLQGGGSTCNNNLSDWYGSFEASFSSYSIFLAPGASGATTVDGYDPNATPADASFALKAFLQGAYLPDNQVMTNHLRQNGSIPLIEPYGELGFSHVGGGGGETTTMAALDVNGINAIVDWVFIELRSSNNPNTVIQTQSALIQRDGDIVSVDGVSPLTFPELTQNSVYIAIRHRNHFGVRTVNPVSISGTVSVDFTSPETPLFGGINATTNYPTKRAMISGDSNQDGQINGVDKINWRTSNAGGYGYLSSPTDFDLNGVLNSIDLNGFWRSNNSKSEQLD